MPRKTAKKSITKRTAGARTSSAEDTGLSYDTKLIIVLLLLVFLYPLGIIFMWAWMKAWPVWLKVLIMLPLLIGLLIGLIFIVMIRALVREVRIERMQELQKLQHERQMQQQKNNQFSVTPGPSVSLSPTYPPNTY